MRGLDNILLQRDTKNGLAENRKQKMFSSDPQDNTTGVSIDTARGKAALGQIGSNIQDMIGGAFKNLLGGVPTLNLPDAGAKPKLDDIASATSKGPEFSSVGTFSGFAGGQLAGSGVFGQMLEVQKAQLAEQRKMNQNADAGGLS